MTQQLGTASRTVTVYGRAITKGLIYLYLVLICTYYIYTNIYAHTVQLTVTALGQYPLQNITGTVRIDLPSRTGHE